METRRGFLQKAAYLTPAILTVAVHPSFANGTYGMSGHDDDDDDGDDRGRGRSGGDDDDD